MSAALAEPLPARTRSVEAGEPRRWGILAVLALAQLMVVLDATVVTIALPWAQKDLNFSDGDRQWIVTAYSLAFGSLLLLGGRLADLIGRKYLFVIGAIGFAAASALGGAATGFPMLVIARAIQGGFGALLAPAALALLSITFTEGKERARAFGIYGAIAGSGAAVGLLLGGVLTEYLDWRWCMFVNIAFAIPAAVGGWLLIKHHPADERPRIDIPGTVTVTGGLFALVYGLSHAQPTSPGAPSNWGSAVTLILLAAAVVLLVAFVLIELRSPHPLLPLRILLERNRGGAFLAMLLSSAGMFGVFLFLTYYLQGTQGYTAVKTGFAFLPMVAAMIVTAAIVSAQLVTRVSPKVLIPLGMLLGAVAMWMFTGLGLVSHYTSDLLPATVVMGVGMGLIFATGMNLATAGVERDDAGVASATVNTMQQVGGSVGTALLNTIAGSALSSYLVAHIATVKQPVTQALAQIHSYTIGFWWSALIFAVGALLTVIVLRPGVPEFDPEAEPALVG